MPILVRGGESTVPDLYDIRNTFIISFHVFLILKIKKLTMSFSKTIAIVVAKSDTIYVTYLTAVC